MKKYICWYCQKSVPNNPKDKDTVELKDPLDKDQPLMHKECYWKMQDLFY